MSVPFMLEKGLWKGSGSWLLDERVPGRAASWIQAIGGEGFGGFGQIMGCSLKCGVQSVVRC